MCCCLLFSCTYYKSINNITEYRRWKREKHDKKYFFFDIDGTLIDIQTGIPVPSALETIKKLQDKGHFVAIATGRADYKTKDTARSSWYS